MPRTSIEDAALLVRNARTSRTSTGFATAMFVILFGAWLPHITPAFAASGDQLWVSRYDGPGHNTDTGRVVLVSPDGSRIFVAGDSFGTTESGSQRDDAVVAYDSATGAPLWAARYDTPDNGNEIVTSVAVSPDGGRVFVTGYSDGSISGADYLTVAFDTAAGATLWSRRYDGPANGADYAYSVAVNPQGTLLFVTGRSQDSVTGADIATIAYRAATGSPVWLWRVNGPKAFSIDEGEAVAVSPDGAQVFVTGWLEGPRNHSDYATIAYEATTGARQWLSTYDGPAHGADGARDVVVSPDGSLVFVTGVLAGQRDNYGTIAYDAANGAAMWTRIYNGTAGGVDEAYSVRVAPDGSRVFVAGYSSGRGTGYDLVTVAYEAVTGDPLWVGRYNGPHPSFNDDGASALTVSPGGTSVYATGWSEEATSTEYDYATVAFGATTGATLWASRYNGSGILADIATSVAVSPQGDRVFVTGYSYVSETGYDFATIAYDA